MEQSVGSTLSGRLCERLESLGLVLALAHADGKVVYQTATRPLERTVTHSPLFASALRRHWPILNEKLTDVHEVLPGIWMLPMPERRRRLGGLRDATRPLPVGVFFSRELVEAEHFHLLCDQMNVDRRAAATKLDDGSLFSAQEVMRAAHMLIYMQQDMAELGRRNTDVHSLSQQLGESYEELSLLYKLSTNMAVNISPVSFLEEACNELQEVVGVRWMALQLSDVETNLNELRGQLITSGDINADDETVKQIGLQLMSKQPVGGAPRVVDDTRALGMRTLPDLAHHLLVVSLMREGKPFGILFAGDKLDGTHMNTVDSKLCSSLANSMAIFLQNAMLYDDMQSMFMGTLHALTASIDAKDSYTHGHSERVALMSRMLAEAAGIDEHIVDRVYIAGLVHDVGKIGVPETVLCKPGHLTDEEFTLIKAHPRIGARILADIRQMQDLIPGVLHHHERWDGHGYPDKLAGNDIPLFGRLIGLADAFDAMSSNRTYRRAMDHTQVIEEIRRCAGAHFDPHLAEIFVNLDFEPLHDLVVRHHPDELKNQEAQS